MRQLRLVHSTDGGEVVIDKRMMPVQNEGPRGVTDIYQGVKCALCHEPLGLLANIDEDTYGPN